MREIEVIAKLTDYCNNRVTIYRPDYTALMLWHCEIIGHKFIVHFSKKINDRLIFQQYWSFVRNQGEFVFDNGYSLDHFYKAYKLCFKHSQAKIYINPLEKLVSA